MKNPLRYRNNGDYLIPNLTAPDPAPVELTKYGRLRKKYLREHRPMVFESLLLTGALTPHLTEIDRTANSRLEQMMPELAKAAGATEELKAGDPLRWVGLMNNCKAQAEEVILRELIYS